jgi:hypothetical protein
MANSPVNAQSGDGQIPGVLGENSGEQSIGGVAGWGVVGILGADPNIFTDKVFGGGVLGASNSGFGVVGVSSTTAVRGFASAGDSNVGVEGSIMGDGAGIGVSASGGAVGVFAIGTKVGVSGSLFNFSAGGFLAGTDPQFHQHAGVYGESGQQGVMGLTNAPKGTGVYGGGTTATGGDHIGVRGETFNSPGVGVQGQSFGTGLAGQFIGNVEVTGTLNGAAINCGGNIKAFDVVLSGGDCAEDFDIAGPETVDPGTVMVIDDEGALRPCQDAYDKKVTGVISGAGDYKPGIVLGKRPSAANRLNRLPLALVGRVYCKVDATFGSVTVGDLLTTSATHGHAMKANDPSQAFGAVIGKALRPIVTGRGLIPILVALQ